MTPNSARMSAMRHHVLKTIVALALLAGTLLSVAAPEISAAAPVGPQLSSHTTARPDVRPFCNVRNPC